MRGAYSTKYLRRYVAEMCLSADARQRFCVNGTLGRRRREATNDWLQIQGDTGRSSQGVQPLAVLKPVKRQACSRKAVSRPLTCMAPGKEVRNVRSTSVQVRMGTEAAE